MENLESDYKKYKWFFTKSGKLVIGGKSAAQNDSLLKIVKKSGKEYLLMHTTEPGSPFSLILSPVENLKKSDLEECAVFTASFSRAWKMGKKKTKVDIFLALKLFKAKGMKEGTWGVSEILDRKEAELVLALTKQKGILRAVPLETLNSKPLLKICPGSIDKVQMSSKINAELKESFSQEEILSALPSGGFSIIK